MRASTRLFKRLTLRICTCHSGRASKALIEFGKLLICWRDLRRPFGALLLGILRTDSYLHYLKDGTPEGEDRVQNVQELYRVTETPGARMLDEFLEEIALVSDVDSLAVSSDGGDVTLHAAKGLEFPVASTAFGWKKDCCRTKTRLTTRRIWPRSAA